MESNSHTNSSGDTPPVALLYFYSDDCAPCGALRAKLNDLLSVQFPGLPLSMIDGKAHPQTSVSHGVLSLPTLILLAEGKEYRRYGIYTSISQVRDDIIKLLELLGPEND